MRELIYLLSVTIVVMNGTPHVPKECEIRKIDDKTQVIECKHEISSCDNSWSSIDADMDRDIYISQLTDSTSLYREEEKV